MVAQLPQVYRNFREKSTDALSFGFVFTWLLGDLTNLIGCIFTKQLAVQLYTAVYYCAVDVVLLGQFAYYKLVRRYGWFGYEKLRGFSSDAGKDSGDEQDSDSERAKLVSARRTSINRDVSSGAISAASMPLIGEPSLQQAPPLPPSDDDHDEEDEDEEPSEAEPAEEEEEEEQAEVESSGAAIMTSGSPRLVGVMLGAVMLAVAVGVASAPVLSAHAAEKPAGGRMLLSFADGDASSGSGSLLPDCSPPPMLTFTQRVIGDICAWICFVMYFIGRIPQISHNYKRKSVVGLSPFMFLCAILGNLFYGTSIVVAGVNVHTSEFWESTLAYILGSYLCVIWPAVVLVQFWYYRKCVFSRFSSFPLPPPPHRLLSHCFNPQSTTQSQRRSRPCERLIWFFFLFPTHFKR